MNLPFDIIKNLTLDNWEKVWDELMVVYVVKNGKHYYEYTWDTEFTKKFIKKIIKLYKAKL